MSDEESKSGQYNDNDLEDEEEEYEDDNNYVQDDFINDEDEESAHDSPKQKPKRNKRKRSHRSEEELDEDDLDLINEGKTKKGRKRLRKATQKEAIDEHELKDESYADENYAQDEFIEGEKKHSYQAGVSGIDSKQLGQFQAIFGDSDEDSDEEPIEKVEQEEQMDDLMDEGAGFESYEKFRSEILKADIPERLFMRLKGRMNPTDDELESEAKWIYQHKDHWKKYSVTEEKVVESIKGVLKLFRKDHYDIPFLNTYRSYLYQQELQASDFYEIYELDKEWNNFLKTKVAIQDRLEAIRTLIPQVEIIDEFLSQATNNDDLEDVHYYLAFQSKINPEIAKKQSSNTRESRKKQFQKIIDAKINEFAAQLVLSPADFTKNLKAGIIVAKSKRMPSSPSLMAEAYRSEEYDKILEVLVATCTYIADDLAAHPIIRKCIIEKYLEGVKISTRPTEKGLKELDVHHPSYRCKRLQFVPLEKFRDDLWADIEQ